MPEFLQLVPPDEARKILLSQLPEVLIRAQFIDTAQALDRITTLPVLAPHSLPEFIRSTVDGYAVKARDTFGATDSQPGYLTLIGEIPMGSSSLHHMKNGQCCLIHTGGMLPEGADAVVMLENTQLTVARIAPIEGDEIEVFRAVAPGENAIQVGEDVMAGSVVIPAGRKLRPAEIGGLMALGITQLSVAEKPKVGLISSGDELCDPTTKTLPGQVRDINAYTLATLVQRAGGRPIQYGIVPDKMEELEKTARKALSECDIVVITAGSSASTRDMTAEVIDHLGTPGVLIHGINTRPGKPTILGVCSGKPVIGLPGNPVSALVNGTLFIVPLVEKALGANPRPRATITAKLTVNVPSQAGREDWIPVKLVSTIDQDQPLRTLFYADPIFGKSNLIFNMAEADGLLLISPDVTGIEAGENCEIVLLQ
jgi:molybdopterin molybdotransferase